MKISSQKFKFDAKFIFLQLENFVLATFLHQKISFRCRFPTSWKTKFKRTVFGVKKVAKTKVSSCKKINAASNLHFASEFLH
jgi:hypothetical protein